MLVYKYRSGTTRDIEALMNSQFYASSMENLNDVYEGKIIIDNQKIELFDLLVKNNASTFDISIKKDLKLKDRIFNCDCGYVEDRDYNASLNLRDAKIYKIA